MSQANYVKEQSERAAVNYQKYFVPLIGEPLARDLVDSADLKSGDKALDVACGTGVVTRLAAEKVGKSGSLTGTDINPGMLTVAKSSTPADLEVEWMEASADSLPFEDRSFDSALCQLSLQFMDNKVKALSEMKRVLKSNGHLYANVPGPAGEMFQTLAESLNKHIKPEACGFILKVFELHDNDEIEKLFLDAGFDNIRIQEKKVTFALPPAKEFLWQYLNSTPVAAILKEADEKACDALEREVVEKWSSYEEKGKLKYEQRVVTVTASP